MYRWFWTMLAIFGVEVQSPVSLDDVNPFDVTVSSVRFTLFGREF